MPFVKLESGDVYYEDEGSGVPIVLTAGGATSLTTMRPLADRLVGDHRVILWDRAGQGLSQVVLRGDSECELFARQLRGLLEHLGVDSAYLAGPSEGSRISFRAALRHPDATRGLFMWQMSAGHVAGLLREMYHEQFARVAEEAGMEGVVRTPYYVERIKYNPSNYERLMEMDPAEFAAVKRKWQEELREEDPILCHTEAEVRQLAVPTRVVAGIDYGHPRDRSEWVAELVPGARLLEPPYSTADWDAVERAPSFYLYGALPGLAELIDELIRENEGAADG